MCTFTSACKSHQVPVISNNNFPLKNFKNKVVILKGVPHKDNKLPSLNNVEVECADEDLGHLCIGKGFLIENIVTEVDLKNTKRANRGPGTFYRLKKEDSNDTVKIKRVSRVSSKN